MYACIYVCMCVCMFLCMCVCIYVCIQKMCNGQTEQTKAWYSPYRADRKMSICQIELAETWILARPK